MGYDVFFMGAFMRMGSNSRFKRSLVYSVCLSLCIITYQRPAYAIIPQALSIAKIYDSAVAGRYYQSLNGETPTLARIQEIMQSTETSLSQVLSRELINFNPSGWVLNGGYTWGAIALTANPTLFSLTELNSKTNEEEIAFISDGVPNGDGTYQVYIDGKEETVTYKPNIKKPIVISRPVVTSLKPLEPTPSNGIALLEKISDAYKYNYYDYYTDLYFHSNSSYDIAVKAVSDSFSRTDYYNEIYITVNDKEILQQKCTIDYSPISLHEKYGKEINTILAHTQCQKLQSNYNFWLYDELKDQNIFNPPTSSNYNTVTNDIEKTVNITINPHYTKTTQPSVKYGSIESMLSHLSPLSNKKLPVSLLTNLLNELMLKAASETHYKGIPFDSTSLFTNADIEDAIDGMGYHPTYYDLFSYAASLDGVIKFNMKALAINIYEIHYGGTNNTTNPPKDNDDSDFDPPDIETPPDDFFGLYDELFPYLRDFAIDEKSADCPVVSFDALGHTYLIDTHCPLLEQNRALMNIIMMIIWAFVSLRIVLKA